MADFIYLVGLPASGKSTWADKNCEREDAMVISSDSIRQDLFGKEEIQGNPNHIFKIAHDRTFDFLSLGVNVIFDSTGLSYKHRIQALQRISKIENVNKRAILFATDYSLCSIRNEIRDRKVPFDVMERMRKSITIPQYNEGWDEISIIWNFEPIFYNFTHLDSLLDVFEQDNPYHTKTVGYHCKAVADKLSKFHSNLWMAGRLHDIGKLYTKVFHDMKGEKSDMAHFYGHESVSAYEALFYLRNLAWPKDDIIWTTGLIQYHMRPYFTKTEKSKLKLLNLVGEEMYSELLILNMADGGSK